MHVMAMYIPPPVFLCVPLVNPFFIILVISVTLCTYSQMPLVNLANVACEWCTYLPSLYKAQELEVMGNIGVVMH